MIFTRVSSLTVNARPTQSVKILSMLFCGLCLVSSFFGLWCYYCGKGKPILYMDTAYGLYRSRN